MNGGAGHELCAFVLWEAEARRKQLELEVAALRGELAALQKEKADASAEGGVWGGGHKHPKEASDGDSPAAV